MSTERLELRKAAHSQSVIAPVHARLGDHRAPPPGVESDAADPAGVDLSRLAPTRTAWLGRGRMGPLRQQSEGEVLPTHETRPKATLGRVRGVGAPHDGG